MVINCDPAKPQHGDSSEYAHGCCTKLVVQYDFHNVTSQHGRCYSPQDTAAEAGAQRESK